MYVGGVKVFTYARASSEDARKIFGHVRGLILGYTPIPIPEHAFLFYFSKCRIFLSA